MAKRRFNLKFADKFRPRSGWGRRMAHARWRLRRFAEKLAGWVTIGIGMLLLSVGTIFAILPGHVGLPVMLLGLILVLRNAFWARRHFIRFKKSHPNWIMPLRKLFRKRPPIASIVWQQLLRTERLIFRSIFKQSVWLGAWRRRHIRKTRQFA